MEVILLQDVKTLGKKGEIVKVNEGYARNFILKKKLGVEANATNLNDLKLQNANKEKIEKEKLDNAKELAEKIADMEIVVRIKTGAGDKVFGSISAKEVAEEVKKQQKIDIDKKKLVLTEPIKTLGTHMVKVKLHPQVTAELKVKVTGA